MSEKVAVECVGRMMWVRISGPSGRYFAAALQNGLARSWQRLSPAGVIDSSGQGVLAVDLSRFVNETVSLSVVSASDASFGSRLLRTNPFQFQVSLTNLRPQRTYWG